MTWECCWLQKSSALPPPSSYVRRVPSTRGNDDGGVMLREEGVNCSFGSTEDAPPCDTLDEFIKETLFPFCTFMEGVGVER
ncbi:hypothetical protein TNIN_75381 [Trichonephila inaurata madagascariensis]|uniref:Uncharacterized protein n=1 Tax=Trichonephila inaurata madagascariensis TaxID=2747483 RepID=A0A8X6WYH3_9ARAC|nr:hypothetical protein TNIN_75381 [Trichonephila inaurata madagascariensis]